VLDYFGVPKGTWTRKAYALTGRVPPNSTVRVAFRYLLFNVQASGGSGDFIGIDAVRIVRTIPSAVEPTAQPTSFALEQNYPNPFNPTTRISYTIPASANGAGGMPVSLSVYNLLGQEVATLVRESKNPGRHTITFDGEKLPSGIYVYHLRVGSFSASRKMLLIR
ncbi:MAG TPA: T9SS type A sorting domain-containing protein, partial [Bacteroidota bacterium]|nr:T9SS type A sorting domain-containing protein [Bacteroidota bacterium]